MLDIIVPVTAGLIVSCINKWILNSNSTIWNICVSDVNLNRYEDDLSSSNTTISDVEMTCTLINDNILCNLWVLSLVVAKYDFKLIV